MLIAVLMEKNPDLSVWIALALAILALAFVSLRTRFRRDPLENKPAKTSLAQHRSVERQMATLVVQLSDMAREIGAGIDTRAAKLDELLRQADERIAELRRLTANVGPQIDLPVPKVETPSQVVQDADPRHSRIYELADLGRNAREIALELGRPTGEIELILALRPAQAV